MSSDGGRPASKSRTRRTSGQQVRIAGIGLRHVAGNPVIAEQLAGGVGRLRETVGQDEDASPAPKAVSAGL
jgi:hypothetical protein